MSFWLVSSCHRHYWLAPPNHAQPRSCHGKQKAKRITEAGGSDIVMALTQNQPRSLQALGFVKSMAPYKFDPLSIDAAGSWVGAS